MYTTPPSCSAVAFMGREVEAIKQTQTVCHTNVYLPPPAHSLPPEEKKQRDLDPNQKGW